MGTDIVLAEDRTTGLLEYSSNNSGGSWWLSDDDWDALAAAGWTVVWGGRLQKGAERGARWLGALATEASKRFSDKNEGVNEWATLTGQDPTAEGCNCCGPPHSFTWTGDDGTTSWGTSMVVQTALDWS